MSTAPVVKNTIYAGQKFIPIADGSKVYFHFQTWKLDKERVLLDDSKKIGKKEPMVLVIGHKFKLEVWEDIVKLMAVGEVASFKVKQNLVFSYPFVSKTLRELGQDRNKIKHTCTASLHTEGIGYPDLDELIRKPCDLEFIIVERSDEYERELWQLNEQERIELIPKLKEKGNKLYGKKQYDAAEQAYKEAISICEQLLIRERKGDEEWVELNKTKLPILLNYAQCKLIKEEYYEVIEHCNTVLEFEPDNEKALFRRGKANIGAWNPVQAEEDFNKLKSLNPSLTATVEKELEYIYKLRKTKEVQDKDALKKLFTGNET
ncbi:Peptidylprolyl isomerase, partial [Operophtera brumata]